MRAILKPLVLRPLKFIIEKTPGKNSALNTAHQFMSLKISIVIPTYNSNALIKRVLESLSTIVLPDNITEIIVVENGSKLDAEGICQGLQEKLPIKYLYTKQNGVSNARNYGTKESKNDVIIFFDNDMKFNSTTLVEYDKMIQQHGEKYFYGGPVLADYEEKPPEWLQKHFPWSAKGHSLGDKIISIDKALFLGGNHAFSKTTLIELGGYDDMCPIGTEGMMGEETRLQEKAIHAGYKGIYIPGAVVYHWIPKERCSQEWAIQRNYRAGLTKGELINQSLPEKPCLLFGIPCYVVKDYFISQYNYILSIFLLKSKQKVFFNEFKLSFLKGIIDTFKSHK